MSTSKCSTAHASFGMYALEPTARPRDYLLIPAKPTPNGRLHLGHIAGPYLTIDILRRHLQRVGHRVATLGGVDSWDPYVWLRSQQENVETLALANRNYELIREDLHNCDIEFDEFVNPLSEDWAADFRRSFAEMLRKIKAQGFSTVREQLLFAPAETQFQVGCLLEGECCECNSHTVGFFCENCGSCNEPSALINPRSRFSRGATRARTVTSRFFALPSAEDLDEGLRQRSLPERYRAIALRYFARYGGRFRLTCPATWGLPWGSSAQDKGFTLWTTGTMYAYCMFLGRLHARRAGLTLNSFHRDSKVLTVKAFGIDNAITHLVGIQGIGSRLKNYRPLDYYLINHFYLLNGEKFSTSRGHAIWVSDFVSKAPSSSDAMRFYLATTAPTVETTNLDLNAFEKFLNKDLATSLNARLHSCLDRLKPGVASSMPENLRSRLGADFEKQCGFLDCSKFSPQDAAIIVSDWIKRKPDRVVDKAYWWLKGFALLSYPLMPRISTAVWHRLGCAGLPKLERFLVCTAPTATVEVPKFQAVSRSTINQCLPRLSIRPLKRYQRLV